MIKHVPVLLKEAVELLNCKKGRVYIDCTVGAIGHAERGYWSFPLLMVW